jgi:predicted nucleotidyltransferase
VLAALKEQNARFVLVGGLAMVAHGSAHVTTDIDVCYARDPETLGAVVEALRPLHPRLRGAPEEIPFLWDPRTLRLGQNFTLVTDAADVDLLGDAAGVSSFEALWENSIQMDLHGMAVRVASLDDLIAMKRAAGRAKDRQHLLELERLRVLQKEPDSG